MPAKTGDDSLRFSCPHCGHTGRSEPLTPLWKCEPGYAALCKKCAGLSKLVFEEGFTLAKLDDDEVEIAMKHDGVRHMVDLILARRRRQAFLRDIFGLGDNASVLARRN